ncbi:serine/threonine protein kinase [Archangium lansingense]|uniref:non-specific serine/threonine protein kinase n=1 Tax=Archangium lansingense TaxID=2995310 RepID=A0ABT4ALI1_9BACT|nr:serine/threonine-protein kinase [Archangium lansinium]MCY1081667.1 serine/threonine-protein kinase [Archangium lansinium]
MNGERLDRSGLLLNVAWLEPGTVVASWRIGEKLGVGGYGAVYRAESVEHPGTFCALKLFLNPSDVRAGREAALLMDKAVHPNVVRCLGTGRWPHPTRGHTFLALELVPGLPLHLWVEEHNPDFARLAYVGADTALALGTLHKRGVLHRDLKPEHLLIRETDTRPMLVDFGSGDYEGAGTLTETPLPPGTAHLRSPEAACFWLARENNPRARYHYGPADELYALGVCLYRALTGHYPFPPVELKFMLYLDVAYREPVAPVDVNPRVPRAFSDAVMRLLAKHPEARYRDGEETHAALLAAVTFGGREPWEATVFEWDETPAAEVPEGAATSKQSIRRPPPPPVQEQPPPPVPEQPTPPAPPPSPGWSRRWRKALVLGLAALVALLAALILTPHAGRWETRERPAYPPEHPTTEVVRSHPPTAVQEVEPGTKAPDTAPTAAPPSPAGVAPAATPPVRQKDDASMKKNGPGSANTPEQRTAPSKGVSSEAWKQALLLCLLQGGTACAGAQLKPQRGDCPPEALAAMKSLGIELYDGREAWLDVTKPWARGRDNYKDGPVISSLANSFGDLPEGSVLYGWLWVTGNGTNEEGRKQIFGRWDKAKLPDGRELPVCFNLANPDGAYELEVGPPEYARLPRRVPLVAVKRFVFED